MIVPGDVPAEIFGRLSAALGFEPETIAAALAGSLARGVPDFPHLYALDPTGGPGLVVAAASRPGGESDADAAAYARRAFVASGGDPLRSLSFPATGPDALRPGTFVTIGLIADIRKAVPPRVAEPDRRAGPLVAVIFEGRDGRGAEESCVRCASGLLLRAGRALRPGADAARIGAEIAAFAGRDPAPAAWAGESSSPRFLVAIGPEDRERFDATLRGIPRRFLEFTAR